MLHQLASHNPDIARLVKKGYAVAFDSNHLIVRDIPYLDEAGALKIGAIVSNFQSIDGDRIGLHDHQILFAGSVPYGLDGRPIPNLGGGSAALALSEACNDVIVERSFSNKPFVGGQLVGFDDFFDKIESYVRKISGPAMSRYEADPLTFRSVEAVPDSVFKFHDTMTSRARINDLAAKLESDVLAIIGLGGTGAYLLDLLVRTPVKGIRAFDLDLYHVHNAYRSPGRVDVEDFNAQKADIYQRRYENFRTGLTFHKKLVGADSGDDLDGVTLAFVCVDKGSSRAEIFEMLISKGIPFIDLGMGLNRRAGPIDGLVRATYYSVEDAAVRRDEGHAPMTDGDDDIYKTNIQIGELNAINAAIAVVKYKQLRGYYADEAPGYQVLFEVGALKIQHHPSE